jgi:Transposase.
LEDRVFKEGRTAQMSRPSKYSPEFRERAVRLARESQSSISQTARDLGMHPETLRIWVRQDEADDGSRADRLASAEREELTSLRRENRELRRANEILKAASVFFARELDQPRPR